MTTTLAKTMPPQNLDAERSVLGSILVDNTALPIVLEVMSIGDFHRESHRLVFDAMLSLSARNEPIDELTLCEELGPVRERVGGVAGIGELSMVTPTSANARTYARIVHGLAVRRRLIAAAHAIINDANNMEDDVKLVVDRAQAAIFEIEAARKTGGLQHIKGSLVETFKELEELSQRPDRGVTGIPTGFEKIDEMTSGLQRSDLIIIAARPSMGKAQPLDAKVLTPTGWTTMGELRVGDAVASVDGASSEVMGIFPQGERQVYRVTFSDGRSTECCGEHLWRVSHRKWPEPRVMSTDDVRAMIAEPQYRGRLWVEPHDGKFGHDDLLPVDPWVLGALIGNASLFGTPIFSTSSEETLAKLRQRLGSAYSVRHREGSYDYGIAFEANCRPGAFRVANPLMWALRDLGLAGLCSEEKFIPPTYLTASREARLDLLVGLLDTDGWVESHGSVCFSTASERLARDVTELVRGLGGCVTFSTKETTFTHHGEQRDGLPAHRCTITMPNPKELDLVGYKAERLITDGRCRRLSFSSIEPTRVAPVQCIAVSHPSHLYVTDDHIVTHNTAIALNIVTAAGITSKKSVALFSLEMADRQLVQRFLSYDAKVGLSNLRRGILTPPDWSSIAQSATRASESQIYVDDSGTLTVNDVRTRCRNLKRLTGSVGLVVIDYLQLMSHPGGENRNQEISVISRGLKSLARELDCPIIALSQLNRSVESRADKRPMMSDLRESGAIEQDADVIAFLYRDEYYNKESADKGVAEFIIGKQRNGPTGTVRLGFVPHLTRFEDMVDDLGPSAPWPKPAHTMARGGYNGARDD